MWSFSAPTITKEQEIAEQEALSAEERQEIHNDLFGCGVGDAPAIPLQQQHHRSLQDFSEELQRIPLDQKEAYLEALQACPSLVQNESSPHKFLTCCHHDDGTKAARRLVSYWRIRRRIFQDKAFMPLTLINNDSSSQSALCPEDIQMIRNGIFQVLPNDQNERPVLVYDHRLLKMDMPYNRDTLLRVLFYFLHVLSADASEFIMICSCRQYSLQDFDRRLCLLAWDLFQEAAPVQLKAMHIVATLHKPTLDLVWPVARYLMGPYYRQRTLLHHFNDDDSSAIRDELRPYGISKDSLSVSLGGSCTLQDHMKWFASQCRREEWDRNASASREASRMVMPADLLPSAHPQHQHFARAASA